MGLIRIGGLILAAAGLIPAQAPPEPTFSVDVRLVRMLATVKDPMGKMVGGLDKQNFRITDNGVPQEVALFERNTEQPLSIALLVDTSRSTTYAASGRPAPR